MLRILKGTKQKQFTKRIFGFDIETADDNKTFVMASIVGNEYKRFFYDKESFIKEIKENYIFRNSCIFATNLSFDFFGIFFNSSDFTLMHRGSNLICATTYFYKGDFYKHSRVLKEDSEKEEKKTKKYKTNNLKSLTFLDSMNYASLSVEKMGDIIGIAKKPKPKFLGKMPKNQAEWDEMIEYNYYDSYITFKFMEFLIDAFEELGASFRLTLASTAISLFKNKYLDGIYYAQPIEVLDEQFESYYGGRTEAFKRGLFATDKIYYYMDFNSLYPSVMRDYIYPDPNSLRVRKDPEISLIFDFEGVSHVEVDVPYMKYPLLPVRRKDGRVIFPIGKLDGWYTHVELREAVKLGCKITKIYKSHTFKSTCRPFKQFIDDLYELRKKYKRQKSKMEYVVKIIMNSAYGKFGEKFRNKDEWQHKDLMSFDDLFNLETPPEEIGEYYRYVVDREPSAACIPIWASYVTAYGRIKLHREIVKHEPVYVDTDSLMIDHPIKDSKELGELKLEMMIKEGIIVRPKFYAIRSTEPIDDKEEHVKIKGLPLRLTMAQFYGILENPKVEYDKFIRFKEAVRRGFIPNEIIKTHKSFSLEDEKRRWPESFDDKNLQDSEPITYDWKEEMMIDIKETELKSRKMKQEEIDEYIHSDLFDRAAVGSDISYEEFLRNEMRGELDE